MAQNLIEGDEVCCNAASIDRKIGEGMSAMVTGFARFSSYHPREAMVRFENGDSDWFWLRDLVPA